MFPKEVLADLSSVHARPSKKPSAYEEHKSNLKKLMRQRQKQMKEKIINDNQDMNLKTSEIKVNNIVAKFGSHE